MLVTYLACATLLATSVSATVHRKSCGGCTEYTVDDRAHVSWEEADYHCRGVGGQLVKIEHRLQQECLEEFLNAIGNAGRSVWIGLRKVGREWRWTSDNSLVTSGYQHWRAGEPSNDGGGQRPLAVHLYKRFNYEWNDIRNPWRSYMNAAYWVPTYPLCQICASTCTT